MEDERKPDIPESALEHVVEFVSPWANAWCIPNPFVSLFYEGLRPWNVTLADFSFRQDAKNLSENALVIFVSKLQSSIIIGLDRLTFRTANPDWDMATDLVTLFDNMLELLRDQVKIPISTQECTIAFHLRRGSENLASKTASLVNQHVVGEAEFYGISKHGSVTSLLIEKSLKYDGGLFFRLSRKFGAQERFADVALALYADERSALTMLGVEDVM